MNNKTTKEILIDARNSAAANNCANLTKGNLVNYKDNGNEVCFCALGHIAKAAGFPIVTDQCVFFDFGGDLYQVLNNMEAVVVLADEIFPGHDIEPSCIVVDYNDRFAEANPELIIAAFDKAIAAIE